MDLSAYLSDFRAYQVSSRLIRKAEKRYLVMLSQSAQQALDAQLGAVIGREREPLR
jgi:hypothetical protein